jgi:predicted MFS family arabinose efflux permease
MVSEVCTDAAEGQEQVGARSQAPLWLAVASLALSTFASVTTEFLPVGLLTSIAQTLGVSEGTAGLMVTMPALAAAIAGPVLLIASGRLDRRVVLLVLSALLVASNVIAALAPNMATMLLARILLGFCVGGFWTFAPGATGHLVPAALQPRAMSYILAGISVATVAGVPAGALLGNLAGWRVAFGASAALATVVLIFQLRVLPPLPTARAIAPRDLLLPFARPAARMGLLLTLFLVTGHFAAYTYLRPMLQWIFGLSADAVTTLLLVYGAAGFIGTFAGGRLVARSVRGTAALAAALIGCVLFASALLGGGIMAGALAALVWGIAFGLVPVSLTSWMLQAMPDEPEAGQALLVSVFQVGISSGALVGGLIVDGAGMANALLFAGTLTVLAVMVIGVARQPAG